MFVTENVLTHIFVYKAVHCLSSSFQNWMHYILKEIQLRKKVMVLVSANVGKFVLAQLISWQ